MSYCSLSHAAARIIRTGIIIAASAIETARRIRVPHPTPDEDGRLIYQAPSSAFSIHTELIGLPFFTAYS